MINLTHVEGKNKGKVVLYALSTCGWCKKVKRLLKELGTAYDYIDADLLNDKDSDEVEEEVKKWNSQATYPTMVIEGKKAINGFKEGKIRKELG